MKALDYARKLTEILEAGRSCVTVTLTGVRGHAPQELGAKILVTAEGLEHGTVGGGKVEAKAIARARELLGAAKAAAASRVTWNLQRDVGMTCGGEVELVFEVHGASVWRIAVFGAGHVAQALVPLLTTLECQVTCFDTREEWLARLPSSPKLKKVCTPDLPAAALALPSETYVMLMTQGHATDLPILKTLLVDREPPYFGVIGSEVKGRVLRKDLLEAGIDPSRVERLRCPMGLPLGNSTPAEIAISMAAQVLQERDRSLESAESP